MLVLLISANIPHNVCTTHKVLEFLLMFALLKVLPFLLMFTLLLMPVLLISDNIPSNDCTTHTLLHH